MSRFNVRAIAPPSIGPPPSVPADKKPSAYAAMKHGTTNVVVMPSSSSEGGEAPTKSRGGRPSKDELRRRKLATASAYIQVLLAGKPSKAKVREHFQNRILQLTEEKK